MSTLNADGGLRTDLFGWIPVSEQRPPLIEETPETNGFFLLLRHNPYRDAAGQYRMHLWFGSVPIDSTHWARIRSLPNYAQPARSHAAHGSASVASNCCGEPPMYVRSFGRWKLMCGRCGRNSSLGIYLPTIARAITVWNTLEEPWDEKPNMKVTNEPPIV